MSIAVIFMMYLALKKPTFRGTWMRDENNRYFMINLGDVYGSTSGQNLKQSHSEEVIRILLILQCQ